MQIFNYYIQITLLSLQVQNNAIDLGMLKTFLFRKSIIDYKNRFFSIIVLYWIVRQRISDVTDSGVTSPCIRTALTRIDRSFMDNFSSNIISVTVQCLWKCGIRSQNSFHPSDMSLLCDKMKESNSDIPIPYGQGWGVKSGFGPVSQSSIWGILQLRPVCFNWTKMTFCCSLFHFCSI